MHTVIWDESEQMLEGPVGTEASAFFAEVDEALTPIAPEAYRDGPAVLLTTEARFAYVVTEQRTYWVVQWPPGFVVVTFGVDGTFGAARLPVEDDDHPVVDLLVGAWEAQFDAEQRSEVGFVPARPATEAAWQAAMAGVQALGAELSEQLTDDAAVEAWRTRASHSPWVRET